MPSRVSKAVSLTVALLALSAGALSAAPASPQVVVLEAKAASVEARAALDRLLFDYDLVELPLARLARRTGAGRLDLVLRGQRFELDLERNDLRAEGFRAVVMTGAGPVEAQLGPVTTFRGTVRGEEGSVVRITADRAVFTGFVKTGADWWFVDPLTEYLPGTAKNLAVVYRETDVRPEAAGLCGVEHWMRIGGEKPGFPTITPKGHTTLRTLQVATEADGQYYQAYGNPGLFNRIQGILNNVDGIYENQINLSISITYQQAWSSVGGDPYTSLDAVTTLNQFRNWWNANRGGTVRDTAHQWSGKDFNGGVVGIAWVGVICNSPSLSYGVSQDLSSSFLRTQLTAHEIGHNLDASHDNQIGCPVSCSGSGPIMCSSLQSNGSNSFSSCSVSAINTHTHNNGSCLQ